MLRKKCDLGTDPTIAAFKWEFRLSKTYASVCNVATPLYTILSMEEQLAETRRDGTTPIGWDKIGEDDEAMAFYGFTAGTILKVTAKNSSIPNYALVVPPEPHAIRVTNFVPHIPKPLC